MSKTYKSYDEDFKKTIVNLYESGKGISDLSREYGISKSVISSWIKKYKKEISSLESKNRNLERENKSLLFRLNYIFEVFRKFLRKLL